MLSKIDDLTSLIKDAQNKDTEAVLLFVQTFKPKLKSSLYQTSLSEREDLEQELTIKVMETVCNYNLDDTPGFFEFIEQIEKKRTE
ncbi:helix-turn-helix domain-containing protein [Aneurinibacillus thermoaerophilus]|uniref:Helix-turn-helix domain-containing protein n=1 Tax=Aneurinibacillus thermoaerophilus TaxID=143495 RepID=A0ABX8YAI4_ANETH|nr:helix-turn-helix domain-containing protein [Aneurinibacillus thermoaerophilus]MED0738997.1 helix-turn-helix domain-containing protein [Aneurinibacillus thermoaerophilus]QYY42707.1 helix-turn-helix domain-containing protein [Aneurinibacillus thermoaerophilus]